jgi:alkanesulfonate monooxygenase SsuD/methylene tetrahydromethanopterin reductase-like flavin-dependent oxidoreductase (luciferase family)
VYTFAVVADAKLVLVLSENWTLTSPRDLRALVRMAVEAEAAGADAVMVSEHLALGPNSSAEGEPENPREYALPGNQPPETPWPSSLVLLSAIASATTRLRLAASAIIAPLRHPIALAKELATLDLLSEGRLVVQPTVSWHRDEYDALGVPFGKRGELLDDHLAAWQALWRDTPTSFEGRHYAFRDVYAEPKPFRPDGPRLWFGGESLHPRLLRRLVAYGHGFNPLGRPSEEDLERLAAAFARDLPGTGRRCRPRAGARLDSRTARAWLHVVLPQAVAVHRRPGRGRRALRPRGRVPRGPVAATERGRSRAGR